MARQGTAGACARKTRRWAASLTGGTGSYSNHAISLIASFVFVVVTQRMGIALASLISALVALYLHLWKLGLTGSLACSGTNGCAYVQGSPYGWFLGIDVALIGTVGYALLFVAALIGTMPAFENARWPNTLMQLMIWPALLFTLRLKYGEFIVLRGFCSWCLVSAIATTLCAILVTLDRRRVAQQHAAQGVS